MPPAAEGIESPYDPEARFRSRHEITWTGYQVHLSETCDPEEVHLITNVETTLATVHESRKTEAIHQALADKALPPDQHLVDSAYVDAEVLISSREQFGISLVGPGRPDITWQARTEAAYHRYCFALRGCGRKNPSWCACRTTNGKARSSEGCDWFYLQSIEIVTKPSADPAPPAL